MYSSQLYHSTKTRVIHIRQGMGHFANHGSSLPLRVLIFQAVRPPRRLDSVPITFHYRLCRSISTAASPSFPSKPFNGDSFLIILSKIKHTGAASALQLLAGHAVFPQVSDHDHHWYNNLSPMGLPSGTGWGCSPGPRGRITGNILSQRLCQRCPGTRHYPARR